ncbi:MAG TPA: type II secretion system protein [Phycisphaerae bacterium]|nr:type II secretion system protein [Phycisphaerae bacterium]
MQRRPTNPLVPRRGARAFTLVELVTAAALMTLMMLGVVQIFSIVTETAGEAEGLQFAHEQLRALFDRLHQDTRGLSREGYLCIIPQIITGTTTYTANLSSTWPTPSQYACDALALTPIGSCYQSDSTSSYKANAAEVVYTTRTQTDDVLGSVLQVKAGAQTYSVDPRRGILSRAEWLLGGAGGSSSDSDVRSGAAFLCNLLAKPGSTAPTSTTTSSTSRPYLAGGYAKVWPWTHAAGASAQSWSLRRVMASCVSEFYVEYFDLDKAQWSRGTVVFNPYKVMSMSRAAGDLEFKPTRVTAIRVTAAVHDPSDRKPLPAGSRARGYALQEVFWIADP